MYYYLKKLEFEKEEEKVIVILRDVLRTIVSSLTILFLHILFS